MVIILFKKFYVVVPWTYQEKWLKSTIGVKWKSPVRQLCDTAFKKLYLSIYYLSTAALSTEVKKNED